MSLARKCGIRTADFSLASLSGGRRACVRCGRMVRVFARRALLPQGLGEVRWLCRVLRRYVHCRNGWDMGARRVGVRSGRRGGKAGAAFLGSQGDVWDAQKDILCDTLGAICSSGLFLWCDRKDPLYWAYKFPDGTAVLNPETDAPTVIWMRSRMKHRWIWDIVGVALIMSVISAVIGLLWLCAIGIRNLESIFLVNPV